MSKRTTKTQVKNKMVDLLQTNGPRYMENGKWDPTDGVRYYRLVEDIVEELGLPEEWVEDVDHWIWDLPLGNFFEKTLKQG